LERGQFRAQDANLRGAGEMGGRLSRNKGARTERAIVRLLQDQGIAAEKISGMYKPGADLSLAVLGVDRAVEVKCRADGFRELYGWLEDRDLLIVKADRQEPLAIVRLSLAAEIAKPRAEWANTRSSFMLYCGAFLSRF
jgi:hypothetical protein